jgi:trehalose 6-phosphate synthase
MPMRLVIVSNRVPGPKDRGAAAGGLAVALQEVLRSDVLWLGWSGEVSANPSSEPTRYAARRTEYATLDVSEDEYKRFYVGFSNSTLWPLFHYRLGLMEFRREDFEGYLAVNRRFAEVLVSTISPDDLVWVHDYHFISIAAEMRAKGSACPIGFYLHIPFPPPGMFDILPCAKRLLRDLCAYDIVGFQTDADRDNFQSCCAELLDATILDNGEIDFEGRQISTLVSAVSIDADRFEREATKAAAGKNTQRLRQSLAGRKLIIGVDRLDYSKGLANRFEAFARLLERFPQHRQRISYLQIAPRSRGDVQEYRSLKRDLDRLCGKINGRFAEFDWVPLRYLTRSLPRNMLAGFYRAADVGLVTPLRDGMNLVAKEFVAAQPDETPGVLVLSRFAGAAQSLQEALLVNPYDPDEIAEAMHRALTMTSAERVDRSSALKARLRSHSGADWCRQFVERLRGVSFAGTAGKIAEIHGRDGQSLKKHGARIAGANLKKPPRPERRLVDA